MKLLLFGAVLCALPFSAGADTVRSAVGVPLQQAEAMIQRHNYAAALSKVSQASKAPNLTHYESLVIAEIGGAAAAGAGDYHEAACAYQTVLASGVEPPALQLQLTGTVAGFYYQANDYRNTITWVNRYIAAQGQDPRIRALLAQSYYQTGDYRDAEQAEWREVKVAQAKSSVPSEPALQLLQSAAQKSGDQDGYRAALEALLSSYPNRTYWAEAIALVQSSPRFSDSLTLDVDRLRLATGTLNAAADYEDYTERAILAGHPREANLVIQTAFSTGAVNDTTDSGHAARLRALAAKTAQTPPSVTADPTSDDPLQAPIDALAAHQKDLALREFRAVQDYTAPAENPTPQLARLWVIYASAPEAAQ